MAKTLSRFYLLKKDENKDKATLFVRVQDPIRKIDVQFTTRLRVSVPEWKVAVSSEDALARHRKEYPKVHDKLGRIEVMLKREMGAPEFDREKVKHEIMAIADPEKSEIVRRQQEAETIAREREEQQQREEAEKARIAAEAERANIWNFLDRFVEEIKSGKRLNGNNRYTAGSCKAWSSFRKLYNGFDPRHRLTWADVDRALVTKFLDHLQKLDYMGSSVNKYLVSFRAMVGYAYEDGLHNNDRALSCFSKRKVEESDKAVEIYLTETELQALSEMELTGLKDQVRDIFLVGCYTCQRVSDYNNIQPEDFTTTAKALRLSVLFSKRPATKSRSQ